MAITLYGVSDQLDEVQVDGLSRGERGSLSEQLDLFSSGHLCREPVVLGARLRRYPSLLGQVGDEGGIEFAAFHAGAVLGELGRAERAAHGAGRSA